MAASMQETYELRPTPATREPRPTASKNMAAESSSLHNSTHSSITVREPTVVHLKRHFAPLLIFIFYCTLALLAWTFSCILSQRPLRGGGSYTEPGKLNYPDGIQRRNDVNEKYIRAAQVLRSIVTLLTIPVTSAICSMAAVAYMQGGAGNGRRNLSLGQLMALADQGWISPRIWSRALGNGAKVASLPLFVALGLTLIGSTAVILQDSFITTGSILGRSENTGQFLGSLVDIPDLFANTDSSRAASGYDVYQLRSLLDSTTKYDTQPNIWVEKTISPAGRLHASEPTRYYSEVPADFNTGVYREAQFAPRMNSTANYTEISAEEFTCRNETENGGFYAAYGAYGSRYPNQGYAFIACMSGDQRNSPWKPTRDRQDISESLYLNISDTGGYAQYFRATMHTSLGYFELPSAANNNTVGPLLAKDPFGKDSPQLRSSRYIERDGVWGSNTTFPGNETLITVRNKPPLLALALALFGPKSFIDARMQHPAAYVDTRPAWLDSDTRRPGTELCVGLRPFGAYLNNGCERDYDTLGASDGDKDSIFFRWNQIFTEQAFSSGGLREALGHGAALANRIWIEKSIDKTQYNMRKLRVFHDEGIRTIKVNIVGGNVGIIVGSVLLGCYLLGLASLVAYTCVVKTWSATLGSEVMVKVGASYAGQLAGASDKGVYDVLSGCLGDAKPDSEIGRLQMGARTGLSGSRKYEILR